MEIMLAEKIEQLSLDELIDVLSRMKLEDNDAYEILKEIVEDTI